MIAHQTQRAGIARAVVCLSWLLECFNCRKTSGEPDECVNPTRQTRWSTSTAGAGSASLDGVPRGAAGRRGGRLECAAAFLTQVHGGTRRRASPFCLPNISMLRQASQNGASDGPDAFAAAALAALIDAARGVPRDNGIRSST